MGLFSAVIDRSPIDQFGASANAAAQVGMSQAAFNRSNDMFNMNSTRNQMQRQMNAEQAFDIQAQNDMMQRRNAARSGQSYNQVDTTSAILNQVQNANMQQGLANQQMASSYLGQAAQMQASAASTRNSLNQLYRQQQQANQQAKQQAKSAALSAVGGLVSGLAGPAIGAIGAAGGQKMGSLLGLQT
tara:strand:+ start:16045 stop:16605 length:561 start_codon:yes stop_codon:yes gene_type:complete